MTEDRLADWRRERDHEHDNKTNTYKSGATGLVIEELWAWVATDPGDNNEGVMAISGPAPLGQGQMMWPLVGADRHRMESLRPQVAEMAKLKKQEIKLVRFSKRDIVDVIGG